MESLPFQLYTSKDAVYPLDPARIFSIVETIKSYCEAETRKCDEVAAQGQDNGSTRWKGSNRKIEISSERRNPNAVRVSLADLTLGEGGETLTLRVYGHTHLMADPATLEQIGEIFKQPTC